MIELYVVNNSIGPIASPLKMIPNDGKPVFLTYIVVPDADADLAAAGGGAVPAGALTLQTVNARSPDMEIFLAFRSGSLRDYGVRLIGDTLARGTDTMVGTRVSLDGDTLTVTVDHVFAPWTHRLNRDRQLHQVTIPGTHDSGTFGMSAYNRCQDLTILEQLYIGVRYFDIRVSTKSAALQVVHSSYPTYYTLAEVAATFRKFLDGSLNVNATEETIVVQIKVDDGPDDAQWGQAIVDCVTAAFDKAVNQPWLDPVEQYSPTFARLRGRLVVLRRFEQPLTPPPNSQPVVASGTPVKYFVSLDVFKQYWGKPQWVAEFDKNKFEWTDPGHGNIDYRTLQGVSFRLQDNYKAERDAKAKILIGVLNDTVAGMLPDSWYLNFASAAYLVTPHWVASYVNPRLQEWLDNAIQHPDWPRYGTILMDYVTIPLCQRLIGKNFL